MQQIELQTREELKGSLGNETYQKNYLIEAGAGAGKTFTMVHRIAHQLTAGLCSPENMAVITFTNKATEEMRKRLDDILTEQRDSASDPDEKLRLDDLIRAVGRMQVSTIHSFCKTMLESMPFESELGMEITYLEDEHSFCKDFFARRYREDPSLFAGVEALDVNCRYLGQSFVELCDINDGSIIFIPESSTEMQLRKKSLVTLMGTLHQTLSPKIAACPQIQAVLNDTLQTLFSMTETVFASNQENALQLAALVTFRKLPIEKDDFDELKKAFKASKSLKEKWNEIKKIWDTAKEKVESPAKELIHSRCMPIMLQLMEEYKQEKRAQHIVSSNDLLVFTRDMLRDCSSARQALHNRYRVLYVDEFQDTDPVQAQILFYLTTYENHFDKDWRKCHPVPGSLFLVGDPKQAIYRFRGADIDVYKDVEKLFRDNEIGDVVRLSFNYRSAQEICNLTAQVFKPDGTSPVPGEADPVSQTLDGGYYQSSYADMTVWNGSCTRARTLYYEPLKGDDYKPAEKRAADASRVAAFIKKMYTDKVLIGCADKKSGSFTSRPVRYSDFLILPPFKDDVIRYASALIDAGIPVNVTGKQVFREIDPIRRLMLHLNSLSSPGNDLALGKVLAFCYGIKLPAIRRFMQQAQINSLSSALYKEKIEALGAAFSAATNRDTEILSLCAVLKELSELRDMVRTKPAMSVIEKLLDGGYSIWADCDSMDRRKREYAYVQQFLQLLRHSPEREFSALVAFAAECSNRFIEHELTLEHNRDAVCVMNVHKSKGLEGLIVILPYATSSTTPPLVLHHAMRTNAERQHECCLYTPNGPYHKTICATPMNWNAAPTGSISSTVRELRYQYAERIRLLYVAATRAATMLLVCDDANEGDGYWKAIALGCAPLTAIDPEYGDQFKCLIQDASSAPKTNIVSTPVDTYAIENNLEQLAQSHLHSSQYPITPSKLDSASRSAVTRKDREENDTLSSDALVNPVDTVKDTLPADDSFMPHGPDWGTIIHRIMELVVRHRSVDADSIFSFARQAVTETLPDDFLTAKQKSMLFERTEDFIDNWVDKLARAAAHVSAFLTDQDAPLRKLLDSAVCYPELPFILREADPNSSLYRHLSDHIKKDPIDGKELDVQGVIDLAIWKNGEWTVVDYKTDRIKKGESRKEYIGRLREEYTAQIASYAQVLERLGKGETTHAYLCSIPLGGELIELDLGNGTDCGQKTVTTQASPAAQTTATTPATDQRTAYAVNKLFANNYFHRVLSDASGTFDFTLMVDGTPVKLTDKNGNCVTEIHKCRHFAGAVQRWLEKQYPQKNCSIDFTNAGNQVLLRRTLKTMHNVLPPEVWNKVEIKWTRSN